MSTSYKTIWEKRSWAAEAKSQKGLARVHLKKGGKEARILMKKSAKKSVGRQK